MKSNIPQESESLRNRPYKFIIAASVVLSLTFCSLQSKHQSVPVLSPKEQQHIIKETQCLNEVLFFETRGEPLEGQLAVLSVIQNRKNSRKYPNTFCGVIKQNRQFSYRNGKGQGLIKTPYKPSEERIKATIAHWSFKAAVGAFKGTVEDSVLFYHSASMKSYPRWALENKFCKDHNPVGIVLRNCSSSQKNPKLYVTIGSHLFYRS